MVLNPTLYGDNPQQPSIAAEVYVPDQLIAGTLHLVTQPIVVDKVGAGAVYPRGQAMASASTSTSSWTAGTWYAASNGGILATVKGFLVDQVDTTGGDANADVYVMGEFNDKALTYDSSFSTVDALAAACVAGLIIKVTSAGLTQVPES